MSQAEARIEVGNSSHSSGCLTHENRNCISTMSVIFVAHQDNTFLVAIFQGGVGSSPEEDMALRFVATLGYQLWRWDDLGWIRPPGLLSFQMLPFLPFLLSLFPSSFLSRVAAIEVAEVGDPPEYPDSFRHLDL